MSDGPVFECHLNTRQPNHLKARQMGAILYLMELQHISTNNFVVESHLFTKGKTKVKTYTTTAREPSIYVIFIFLTGHKKTNFCTACSKTKQEQDNFLVNFFGQLCV